MAEKGQSLALLSPLGYKQRKFYAGVGCWQITWPPEQFRAGHRGGTVRDAHNDPCAHRHLLPGPASACSRIVRKFRLLDPKADVPSSLTVRLHQRERVPRHKLHDPAPVRPFPLCSSPAIEPRPTDTSGCTFSSLNRAQSTSRTSTRPSRSSPRTAGLARSSSRRRPRTAARSSKFPFQSVRFHVLVAGVNEADCGRVGKWVFAGCIIFSFLLLLWEARKSRAIIKSCDISYA